MTLLLCSQNDIVRTRWFSALKQKYTMHQATSVGELHSTLQRFQPDIMLVHRSMMDGEQLRDVCEKRAGSKVFVFADRPENLEGSTCLRMGCVGYANTYISQNRLVSAVEVVESGLVWIGNSLMQHLITSLTVENGEDVVEREEVLRVISRLSKRECQIARLVAGGMHNGEIGAELGITERTVKAHLSAVYIKTRTKGRLNLALLMNKA